MTQEHIKIIAKKKSLKYSYSNEYQYNIFVEAISEGIEFGLLEVKEIVKKEKLKLLNSMLKYYLNKEIKEIINKEINIINGKVI